MKMRQASMKRRKRVGRVFTYICLVFWSLVIGIVLYGAVVNTFKGQSQSSKSFFALPESLDFANYIDVWNRDYFLSSTLNTMLYTVAAVAVIAVFVPAVSYAINQNYDNRFFRAACTYFTASMFIPFQIVALPLAMFMNKIGLSNRLGVTIIYIVYPLIMGVYLCHGYLKSVPKEMAEAAYVEGASVWQAFFRVIYPIMKPMTATIVIMNFLWIWNEFLIALMMLNNSRAQQTLPIFIYSFKGQYTVQYNLLFTAIVLSSIPITIMYVFFQKYIVAGLTGGAVKG